MSDDNDDETYRRYQPPQRERAPSNGDTSNLRRLQVNALNVIGWVAALSTISIWLGWSWLSSRITNLEQPGGSTPMSLESRVRFNEEDKEHNRLEAEDSKIWVKIGTLEQRIRDLENQNHNGRPHDPNDR